MLTFLSAISLFILVGSGVYYGWQWVVDRAYFKVELIRIEGKSKPLTHINPQAAKTMVMAVANGNFFQLNLAEIRDAFKGMPWVRSVSTHRRWPNTLVIRIEEYQLFGRWGDDALLSPTGDVFSIEESVSLTGLPQFSGPAGSSTEVIARFKALQKIMQPLGSSIAQLHLTETQAWHMTLANGIKIELGRDYRSQSLEQKVQRLVQVFSRVQKNTVAPILRIDLRYPNGFAMATQ